MLRVVRVYVGGGLSTQPPTQPVTQPPLHARTHARNDLTLRTPTPLHNRTKHTRSLLPRRNAKSAVAAKTSAAAEENLWAWYHDELNPFFKNYGEAGALIGFATFVFSVDVTSSFIESVFSVAKSTKTKHRGRMGVAKMDEVIRQRRRVGRMGG
jgi:hypothetical protein